MCVVVGDVDALVTHTISDGDGRESHVDQQAHMAVTKVVDADALDTGLFSPTIHLSVQVALGGRDPGLSEDEARHRRK